MRLANNVLLIIAIIVIIILMYIHNQFIIEPIFATWALKVVLTIGVFLLYFNNKPFRT